MKQCMIFHLKGMTSSANTSLCAVLTPNGLCGPRNAPGQGGTFQGRLLKHGAPPNPQTLEMGAGLGALVLMAQAQIPAVVDIIKCRFFCWTQMSGQDGGAGSRALLLPLPLAPSCRQTTLSLLTSRCFIALVSSGRGKHSKNKVS